ncbi:hypothetical protein BXO88_11390 [Oribacterium sp. C9]|uniref:SLC13 family permease n=1 Tax=Oribacterium sp. C9 TaxID=1943579 RepID=UPI0009900CC4|nr:SLC13 family permease [Oribacterium sp. C9]OON85683.1 hypothetical protein BXO88_11390 [Oribacterium sp. C9]
MSLLTICFIIFVLTIIGYCSGKYSLAVFALTSMMLMMLTGCLPPDKTLGYFSNSNVIMVGGMCVVAAGFNKTQFCVNLAKKISGLSKGNAIKMVMGYVLIGVILSQFIQSPVVVLSIVAPMLIATAEELGLTPTKVIFPVGIAIIATCCVLPVGAGATIAAELNGYLESYGYMDYTVGLLDPMKARLPMLLFSVIYFGLFCVKGLPMEPSVSTQDMTLKKIGESTLTKFQEYASIVIFFGDALALMFSKQLGLDSWSITVIGALLMVLCNVLKPAEAGKALPLRILFLIVGSNAIAGALSATGAGDFIGNVISGFVGSFGNSNYLLGFIFFVCPFILTQFMSNRGTMLIFHPIAIATCAAMGGNPVGLMILIQAACLTAFMTPMSTSATPYIMGLGGYDVPFMIKHGALFAVVGCIISVFWTMTIFPVL